MLELTEKLEPPPPETPDAKQAMLVLCSPLGSVAVTVIDVLAADPNAVSSTMSDGTVTVGPFVSTDHVKVASAPTLPALSIACTEKVRDPSATGKLCPLVQAL